MNLYLRAIAAAGLALLTGCSRNLNASRAVKIAEKFLETQKLTEVQVDHGLPSLLNVQSTVDIGQQPPGLQRLVRSGYLEQKTFKVVYPDLTGKYQGPWWSPAYESSIQLDLQMNRNRPPGISGTFTVVCFDRQHMREPQSCSGGSVSGSAERQMPYRLSATGSFITNWATTPPNQIVLGLNSSGGEDVLEGNYILQSPFGTDTAPLRLRGKSARQVIEQSEYTYSWSSKVPAGAVLGGKIKLGRLEFDKCDKLLLSSETSATGDLSWHIQLEDVAKSLFGKDRIEGVLSGTFGKETGGGWVVTHLGNLPIRVPLFD